MLFLSAKQRFVGEPAAMRPEEYQRLERLLHEVDPVATLEVGMANGGSAAMICAIHKNRGCGTHISIDPFQNAQDGWRGRGVERLRETGLLQYHTLMEEYDYLALPQLVAEKRTFDFILIDGWHSFDYTLVDLFFADLLLKVDGTLVIHDTGWPAVYRACRFLETHKSYELVSPPPAVHIRPFLGRVLRRLANLAKGGRAMRMARARRGEWFSLAAYRKCADSVVPEDFYRAF